MQHELPSIDFLPNPGVLGETPAPRKGKNRRLLIFLAVFIVCLGGSLAYVWQLPPIYRSSASLLTIAPDEGGLASADANLTEETKGKNVNINLAFQKPDDAGEQVSLQTRLLLGVPLLEETLLRFGRLPEASYAPGLAVADLKRLFSVEMAKGTHLAELRAQGPEPKILAPLVNAWIDAYEAMREKNRQEASENDYAALQSEARELGNRVAEKRAELERFRLDHNILSSTDTENQPMSRLKGLNEALNRAVDEQVKAKSKLEAIRAAIARREPVMPPEDAPGLENLEQTLQKLREQQKDLLRRYTPAYLAMEPKYKEIPGQIAEAEQAIAKKHGEGARAVLSQAEQASVGAAQTVQEIRQRIDALKKESSEFSNRFAEMETMKTDLESLEGMLRDTQARLARAESRPKENYPPLKVVDRAYTPNRPALPNYWLDSLIALGGSLAFALALIWLYDYLMRIEEAPPPAPMPSFQFYSYQGYLPQGEMGQTPALPQEPGQNYRLPQGQGGQEGRMLEGPLPRDLTETEIRILLEASTPKTRLWIGLLLSGLAIEEIRRLRPENIADDRIVVEGDYPRYVPLAPCLQTGLASALPAEEPEEIAARIACAAVDSGLPDPAGINPATLRHAYLAHLVRQGIRLSELEKVVGPMPAKILAAYARYSPPCPGLPAEKLPWVHPALLDNTGPAASRSESS